jgi:hypothetical protein
MQRVVHSINLRVEQCQLDIQECLQHHHLSRDDLQRRIDFFFLYVLFDLF